MSDCDEEEELAPPCQETPSGFVFVTDAGTFLRGSLVWREGERLWELVGGYLGNMDVTRRESRAPLDFVPSLFFARLQKEVAARAGDICLANMPEAFILSTTQAKLVLGRRRQSDSDIVWTLHRSVGFDYGKLNALEDGRFGIVVDTDDAIDFAFRLAWVVEPKIV